LKKKEGEIYRTLAVSLNDKLLFAGASNLEVWNMENGKLISNKNFENQGEISTIALSHDDKRLLFSPI